MNEFLLYIGKSTLCLSILYGVFYILLGKENFFTLNRRILITIIIFSAIIPLTYMPRIYTPEVSVKVENIEPFVSVSTTAQLKQRYYKEHKIETYNKELVVSKTQVTTEVPSYSFSLLDAVGTLYLIGFIITLLVSIIGIYKTIALVYKSQTIKENGYSLLVMNGDVPAFSFCRCIVISKNDYQNNREEILTHEEAHVRNMHSLDLLLLMFVRIIYWFNPLVYLISSNLKEIHEYQADEHTIKSGVNVLKYQRLIIQKSVGFEQFALANSFHHCQIKKRIAMINKKQTSKNWKWKAAAFIPVACILLMSFSNTIEKTEIKSLDVEEISPISDSKHWSEDDFKNANNKICNSIKRFNKLAIDIDDLRGVSLLAGYKDTYCPRIDISNDRLIHQIKIAIDFGYANSESEKIFKTKTINGKKQMVSSYAIVLRVDPKSDKIRCQEVYDIIGKTILTARNKYSNKLYNKKFNELEGEYKLSIEKLIPFRIFYKKEDITYKRVSKYDLTILLNARSKIIINNKTYPIVDKYLAESILKHRDYYKADDISKHQYVPAIINEINLMRPTSKILWGCDDGADSLVKKKVLSIINKTLISARTKYSKKIYKKEYSELNSNEKEQIDLFMPVKIYDVPLIKLSSTKRAKDSRTEEIAAYPNMYKHMEDSCMFIKINKNAFLMHKNTLISDEDIDIKRIIDKYRDYSKADNTTKKLFKQVLINGENLMVCDAPILLLSDNSMKSVNKAKKLTRKIKSIFNKMNESFSVKIFYKQYSTLNEDEKHEISKITNLNIIVKAKRKG